MGRGCLVVGTEARCGLKYHHPSVRASTSGLKGSPERSGGMTRPCGAPCASVFVDMLRCRRREHVNARRWSGSASAPALQKPGCHGDGDEHVERAGLRVDAGAGRSGGGVRRAAVRVCRHGVVRLHGLVSRQRGGVFRGDCALRYNLRREKRDYHMNLCKRKEKRRAKLRNCYAKRNTSRRRVHPRFLSWILCFLVAHICMLLLIQNLNLKKKTCVCTKTSFNIIAIPL